MGIMQSPSTLVIYVCLLLKANKLCNFTIILFYVHQCKIEIFQDFFHQFDVHATFNFKNAKNKRLVEPCG